MPPTVGCTSGKPQPSSMKDSEIPHRKADTKSASRALPWKASNLGMRFLKIGRSSFWRLGSKADLHISTVEDCKLGLEEDIAIDGKWKAGGALQPTVADCGRLEGLGVDRGVVHELTRNDGIVATDTQRQIGQGCIAGEDIAPDVVVVSGIDNLVVVRLDNGGWNHQQGGTRIGDGFMRSVCCHIADREAVGLELPETARVVDIDKCEVAVELGLIDETKVVIAFCTPQGRLDQILHSVVGLALPSPFFRFAENSGIAKDDMAFEKKVFCEFGLT